MFLFGFAFVECCFGNCTRRKDVPTNGALELEVGGSFLLTFFTGS
jgi:hypothetical protein